MTCVFVFYTISYLCFLWFELYFVVISLHFYELIPLLYVFHLTTIFHHCLLLLLCHFVHTFFWLYRPFLYSIFLRSFRCFILFSISLYSLNTLFTEMDLSWLIYESIKNLEIKTFTEVSGCFISFLISLYSLNTLFTETDLSGLIYESIKDLEIGTFTEVSGCFISFLISLYSLNTLFTETDLSWLIYESIKDLEIRTSIAFNLSFPDNFILSRCALYTLFLFLYNWLIHFWFRQLLHKCLFLLKNSKYIH